MAERGYTPSADEVRRIVAFGAIYDLSRSFEGTVAYLASVGESAVPRTEGELVALKGGYWAWANSDEGKMVRDRDYRNLFEVNGRNEA